VAGQQGLQHLAANRREFLFPPLADPFGMQQRVRGAAAVIVIGGGKSWLCQRHFG